MAPTPTADSLLASHQTPYTDRTLDAIRDLHLVFSQHDKAVEYTVFAQCRNARSLYIGCADRGTPTFAVAPLQQLLAALRRLERLEFAEHVRQLANLRLPTFLRYLSLPVEAVEGARLDYLFVWEIKLSFCLKCSGSAAVPPLPRLPWDTLKSVELVFERDPTQELVLLAGQTQGGVRALKLHAVRITHHCYELHLFIQPARLGLLELAHAALGGSRLRRLVIGSDEDQHLSLTGRWDSLLNLHLNLHLYLPTENLPSDLFAIIEACPNLLHLDLAHVAFSSGLTGTYAPDTWLAKPAHRLATGAPALFGLLYRLRHDTRVIRFQVWGPNVREAVRWSRRTAAEDFVGERYCLE
ncbi:hypothetical protein BMF94_3799 [Rhodotorula taiwanensis]|uniref:F-box domain-containing protein n=1 Tax=Rhodotorula taiwanensis TaxID=741276 RepID=A0A2S5B8T1_9BASI|nr:hypothetical protein BMF94_3799 [Rhodotorula taiwanensis]